jgi:predicted nuclease of predicted toxin-antitoxin system
VKILLDECLPKRLAPLLTGHDVQTVRQMNWLGLSNGKLLAAADPHFQVFITVDKNLVQQQNLTGFRIAVVVLRARSNKIEDLSPLVPNVLGVLPTLKVGQVVTIGP